MSIWILHSDSDSPFLYRFLSISCYSLFCQCMVLLLLAQAGEKNYWYIRNWGRNNFCFGIYSYLSTYFVQINSFPFLSNLFLVDVVVVLGWFLYCFVLFIISSYFFFLVCFHWIDWLYQSCQSIYNIKYLLHRVKSQTGRLQSTKRNILLSSSFIFIQFFF